MYSLEVRVNVLSKLRKLDRLNHSMNNRSSDDSVTPKGGNDNIKSISIKPINLFGPTGEYDYVRVSVRQAALSSAY